MKTRTIIALLVSFICGIAVQLYVDNYLQTPISGPWVGSLIGGGMGLMVGSIIIPLIVCLIIYVINKKFPQDTFTILTYVMTALVSYIMVHAYNLNH